jgi:hypothetical protein
VAVRHYLLAGSALLVLVLMVVLYREVRSSPDVPSAPLKAAQRDDVPEVKDEDSRPVVATVGDRVKPATPSTIDKIVKRPSDDSDDRPEKAPQTADTVKLDDVMAEANKAYDRQDLDEARTFAQKVLKQQPSNSRMLRIMVSAACIENDAPEAQKHYNLLPKGDRDQMKTRCARYGVTFTEPPPPAK